MALSKRDWEFRLPKITYIDFKQIEMDRVLTAFFARLMHKGYPNRLNRGRRSEITIEAFTQEFLEHPEWFTGFETHRDVLTRWVETHLMDVVNRGKPTQAVAAPRPLHGFTYRFRNPRYSRDYGAAQHLYEMLYHARNGAGQKALEQLHSFFFRGHDRVTGGIDGGVVLDVETQALLRLMDQVEDAADTRGGRDSFPPLCVGAADLLAEDVMRLLFFQRFIPRSVMVDYLKILFAFHLALYHLRLLKLLPSLVRRQGADPACDGCPVNPRSTTDPYGDCPHRVGLLVDVAGQAGTPMAVLAERSADLHYRRIPGFVKAHFAVRKLDEFAKELVRQHKKPRPDSGEFMVGEVLELLGPAYKDEREKFFGQRVYSLLDTGDPTTPLDPRLPAIAELRLGEFEAYIEMLVELRGAHHRRYITECLDSLLLKNRAGAVIVQPRVRHAPRRFVLDSRLLEVLLQITLLSPGGALGYHTGEIRIEDLLAILRRRYGLHIDRVPRGDGFTGASIDDQKALKGNLDAFIARLRELGFYRDLSDAYVTQTVTPRYQIDENGQTATAVGKAGTT
jgi:hypothetical protein